MGDLFWANFVFLMFSLMWIPIIRRNPGRMLGKPQTHRKQIFLAATPWVLGIVAASNGVLWILPVLRGG